MRNQIERLCLKLGLGNLSNEPELVSGGLLHTMYHVRTHLEEYAIKVLNPSIMNRPDAVQNMINSEAIARQLKNIIPLVAARKFDGNSLIEFESNYYMIFDWLDGKSIFIPNISIEHCQHIGRILGKIHTADIYIEDVKKAAYFCKAYAWNQLLEIARENDIACFDILKDHLDKLIFWNNRVIHSWPIVAKHQVISHRDLDPKNVIWKDGQPFLIDWESAGFVNPSQELVEIINYWATDEIGEYCQDRVESILRAYTESVHVFNINWDAVLDCGFKGMLGWTEYNVKLALSMEGAGIEDRKKGLHQIQKTLAELYRYDNQMEQLKKWIGNYL